MSKKYRVALENRIKWSNDRIEDLRNQIKSFEEYRKESEEELNELK